MKQTNEHLTVAEIFQRIAKVREEENLSIYSQHIREERENRDKDIFRYIVCLYLSPYDYTDTTFLKLKAELGAVDYIINLSAGLPESVDFIIEEPL